MLPWQQLLSASVPGRRELQHARRASVNTRSTGPAVRQEVSPRTVVHRPHRVGRARFLALTTAIASIGRHFPHAVDGYVFQQPGIQPKGTDELAERPEDYKARDEHEGDQQQRE